MRDYAIGSLPRQQRPGVQSLILLVEYLLCVVLSKTENCDLRLKIHVPQAHSTPDIIRVPYHT